MICKDCIHYEVCGGFTPTDLDTDVFDYCREGRTDEIPDIEWRCNSFKPKSRYIELPCAVGDTVYVIEPCTCYSRFYANSCKEHFNDDKRIKALLIVPRGTHSYRAYASCFKLFERKFQLKHLNKIGKTVFLTREEAERALKVNRDAEQSV